MTFVGTGFALALCAIGIGALVSAARALRPLEPGKPIASLAPGRVSFRGAVECSAPVPSASSGDVALVRVRSTYDRNDATHTLADFTRAGEGLRVRDASGTCALVVDDTTSLAADVSYARGWTHELARVAPALGEAAARVGTHSARVEEHVLRVGAAVAVVGTARRGEGELVVGADDGEPLEIVRLDGERAAALRAALALTAVGACALSCGVALATVIARAW